MDKLKTFGIIIVSLFVLFTIVAPTQSIIRQKAVVCRAETNNTCHDVVCDLTDDTIYWVNLQNIPELGNTSWQIFSVVDNGTFQYNISRQVCAGTNKFSGYDDGVFTCSTDDGGVTDVWLNTTGDVWQGNQDANDYNLTNIGRLIASSIELKGNLTFDADGLYSIGDSTNWLKEIFVKNIYAEIINSTNITTVNLEAKKSTLDNITTKFLLTNESEDIVVILR